VCVVVLVAAGAVAFSTVTTASARFAASTANESSLFAAAEIDLVVDNGDDGAAARLLVDADGLYPGLIVERCLVVTHRGSLEGVDVRLHVAPGSDSGLARFLRTDVDLGEGVDAECGDFEAIGSAFSGTLSELLADHGSFPQGIDLMSDAGDGQAITLRVSFEVESDDRAQGLSTDFTATLEARP
jgi:hypothetical protein